MCKGNKEYDAFGPWILEINKKHTIPPLFIDYYTQTDTPLLFIKIPRNIDRRDACPGMNLYDYVIAIFNEHMEVLHRKSDDSVRVMTIPYTDIKLIKNRHNLLKGILSLYMEKETIQIDYNTVSENIIMKMICFIRLGYVSSPINTFKFTPLSDFSNQLEILYSNLIKEMKKSDSNIDILAIQSKITLKEQSLKKTITKIFNRKSLESSIFFTNYKELMTLEKGLKFKNRTDVDYSYIYTYLPLHEIKNIEIDPSQVAKEINCLKVYTSNHCLNYFFHHKNFQIISLYDSLSNINNYNCN